MPTPLAPLSYVYIDGGVDTYVHDAEVRVATREDTRYGAECQAECGTRLVPGQVILVTDANAEGESTFHLPCILATSGALMAREDAEALRATPAKHHTV